MVYNLFKAGGLGPIIRASKPFRGILGALKGTGYILGYIVGTEGPQG